MVYIKSKEFLFTLSSIFFYILFSSCSKESNQKSLANDQIAILNDQIALVNEEYNDEKIYLQLFKDSDLKKYFGSSQGTVSSISSFFDKLSFVEYNQIGGAMHKSYYLKQLADSEISIIDLNIPDNCIIETPEHSEKKYTSSGELISNRDLDYRRILSLSTPLISENGKYAFIKVTKGKLEGGLSSWMFIYINEDGKWKEHDRLMGWIE